MDDRRKIKPAHFKQKLAYEQDEIELKNGIENASLFCEKTNGTLADICGIQTGIGYFFRHIVGLLKIVLDAIPWLAIISLGFNCLFKAILAGSNSQEGKYTRIIRISVASIALTLGIIAFTAAQLELPLILASTVADALEHVWDISVAIKSYFFGCWKNERNLLKANKENFYKTLSENPSLIKTIADCRRSICKKNLSEEEKEMVALDKQITQDKNQQLKHYGELAEKIHDLTVDLITLSGVILLFTPAAPVGAGILIGVACYGVLDKLHMNPFKYLAKKIVGNPFEPKTHHTTLEKIQSTLKKKYNPSKKRAEERLSLLRNNFSNEISLFERQELTNKIPSFNSEKILQGIKMATKTSPHEQSKKKIIFQPVPISKKNESRLAFQQSATLFHQKKCNDKSLRGNDKQLMEREITAFLKS